MGTKNYELVDAYNADFFAYLKAFFGAHFDYNWIIHFPPSTSKFMEGFKVKNATDIEQERLKIESQKKKRRRPKLEGQASTQKEGDAAGNASPTENQGEAL